MATTPLASSSAQYSDRPARTQRPATQENPARQPAGELQLVAQVVAPQTYGAQSRLTPTTQVPAPLQRDSADSTEPLQLAAAHEVFAGYSRQPPLPSHPPILPQVAGSSAGQWPPGSWARGTGLQVPRALARLQLWQVCWQADPQQTPSTQ
jgi:hypothetical protein